MNAYDLAKELDAGSSEMEYNYNFSDWKLLSDAANMLRHQADRIAELEKDFKDIYNEYKEYYKQTDKDLAAYQQQAAELWNDSCTSNRSTK